MTNHGRSGKASPAMRIVGVIQARTGSTRLPGKVLLPLGARTVLEQMVDRVRRARELDELVIATTYLEVDEPIRSLAARVAAACVSGHPTDLVDRHLQAAREMGADAVVKIPSDCPLVDPRVIDRVVGYFRRAEDVDYVSNLHPPTWPDGNDVEVMTTAALSRTWRQATRDFEREHTTPFLWDQPGRFRVANVEADSWRRPELPITHRLTLDYPEDHQVIGAVFDALHDSAGEPFSAEEIVAFLDRHPEIRALNRCHAGTTWMTRHAAELQALRTNTRASAEELAS